MAFINSVNSFREVLEQSDCYKLALRLSEFEKQILAEAGFEGLAAAVSAPLQKLSQKECKKAVDDLNDLDMLDQQDQEELSCENQPEAPATREGGSLVNLAKYYDEDCYSGGQPRTEEEWDHLYRSAARGIAVGMSASSGSISSYIGHMRVHQLINSDTEVDRKDNALDGARKEELRRIRNLMQVIEERPHKRR